MTNQEILDNAPEKATHVDGDGDYWICDQDYCILVGGYSFSQTQQITMRSLADIRRIVELEQSNTTLRGSIKEINEESAKRIAAQAEEIALLKDSLSKVEILFGGNEYVHILKWVDKFALEQQAKGIEDGVTKLENPDAPLAEYLISNYVLLDRADKLRQKAEDL